MESIFVSHSKEDKQIIHFLLEAFAGTKVKPVFEEFETELPKGKAAEKITQDINTSNAVFVLLSETVESLKHTRDWITWECGTAQNKDIWIFEPFNSFGKISIASPRVTHLVRYGITESWRSYIRNVIHSYDASHVLPTLAGATAAGAALVEKDRATGAVAGFFAGLAGLVIRDMAKPTFGISISCWNCKSNYRVHLPKDSGEFRCATCNSICTLPSAQMKQVGIKS